MLPKGAMSMNEPDAFSDLFATEQANSVTLPAGSPWKILLVDDEPDIRAVLRLALSDLVVEGLPLQLLEAESAELAKGILATHPDIALVLLDVVMETDQAGLSLVRTLRDEMHSLAVRIVMVTGQPGYAPPLEVVRDYDIDGYCPKSDLTAEKIRVIVHTALRAYKAFRDLASQRDELEATVLQRTANLQTMNSVLIAEKTRQDSLIKELADAHAQLLQSEKLASVGQLAAGVAHELNNPISFVHSNIGTLETYLTNIFEIAQVCEEAASNANNNEGLSRIAVVKKEKDFDFIRHDVFKLMAESKDGIARVRKIVQDLKAFTRAGDVKWQWSDIEDGIDSTLNIVWNELKYKCIVNKKYSGLPQVWCVPSQLNQVFLNLLVNASDAIATNGEITLQTGQEGEEVFVSISDSGAGIPPEIRNRIFEPFFTTKPVGKGTGLGLSIAYGIINNHGGRIETESKPGKGTTFTLWLPIKGDIRNSP
jgi:signal transduction histidine kinase